MFVPTLGASSRLVQADNESIRSFGQGATEFKNLIRLSCELELILGAVLN